MGVEEEGVEEGGIARWGVGEGVVMVIGKGEGWRCGLRLVWRERE